MASRQLSLSLLGGFELTLNRERIPLSPGSERLVAYTALRQKATKRECIAGALWPAATAERSLASLRSELWRLHEAKSAIEAGPVDLSLSPSVSVDLNHAIALARHLTAPGSQLPADWSRHSFALLSSNLLPGWYEDWTLVEADRWTQLRLHGLEAASRLLVKVQRFSEALEAALEAVAGEPLRESAYAAAIEVHLAEGNQSEALRTFRDYRKLLRAELGLEPTENLRHLMSKLRTLPAM